jgi:hypothetical protein
MMRSFLLVVLFVIASVIAYKFALWTGGYRMEERGWKSGYRAGYYVAADQAAERGFGVWVRIEKDGKKTNKCRFKWGPAILEPIAGEP